MKQSKGNKIRPDKVSIAIGFLYLALVLGVIRITLEISTLVQTAPLSSIIFVSFFTLTTMTFLIYMIWKGRNWARITVLVISIIGTPFFISVLLQSWIVNIISGVSGVCQIVLHIIAFVFLFQKQSSDWFKAMKNK